MPELPEVETIKRQLERVLVGQIIESVDVLREKSWEGEMHEVVGKRVMSVERKGKMLIVGVGDSGWQKESPNHRINRATERRYLLVHLKMTGQLVYQETRNKIQVTSNKKQVTSLDRIVGGHPTADWENELPSKHTRVIIKLEKGTLYFNDQRVFGWIRQVTSDRLQVIRDKMPEDIIDREMTSGRFWRILQRSRRAVKLVIMDSAKMGGVGNIYANDGLWLAKIDPQRPANLITKGESKRLLKALITVVNRGIEYGGATASDNKYINSSGLGGKYQDHFLVYEREGERCKRQECKGVIKKIKIGGRGSLYCPKCQR